MPVCFIPPNPPKDREPRSLNSGFTAIELMVVVAIVAILAALAGPSFAPLIERWRVRDAAENLTSSLYFARSEAIKRGGNVIIKATTGTDWSTGWHVFFDADNGRSQGACVPANNPNECDLQVLAASTRLDIALPTGTGAISVDRWGMMSHLKASGPLVSTAMGFELKPTGKAMSDVSAVKICLRLGGGIVRVKGTDPC